MSTVWLQLVGLASLFGAEQGPNALLEEGVLRPFEDAPEVLPDMVRVDVRGHLVELIHVIDDASLDVQVVFDLLVVDHCAE